MDTNVSPTTPKLSATDIQIIRRTLEAKGLRGADIDDAVQEVNLTVLRKAPADGGAGRWATRVAINVAMDHHRRERRTRRLEEQLVRVSTSTVLDRDVADHLTIAAAVAALAPEHRDVVRLHFFAGLTVPETARLLNIANGTVKSRLHRAVCQLRRLLGVTADEHGRVAAA